MWDAGDAREHVGQPGQRIDIVELCRRNERGHGGCPGSAALGTGEEPRPVLSSRLPDNGLGGRHDSATNPQPALELIQRNGEAS